MIPAPLWNASVFALQFNFTIAHIPGTMNTAADFLYRLEMDTNGKTLLKTREDLFTQSVGVNIESTGTAQAELVYSDTGDTHETTEKTLRVQGRNKSRYTQRPTSHCSVVVLCQ